MNAYVERFNRTIQEEFVNVKEVDPYNNIDGFNRELVNYLVFYNTKRIHSSIGNLVPLMYIFKKCFGKKSNMLWTYTKYLFFSKMYFNTFSKSYLSISI